MCTNRPYKVVNIVGGSTILIDGDGMKSNVSHALLDSPVKEGDVVYCRSGYVTQVLTPEEVETICVVNSAARPFLLGEDTRTKEAA